MNCFTEKSINLANQDGYLDELFKVYPLNPNSVRNIQSGTWSEIEKAYRSNDNIRLIKALLKLELFPVKDGYVPFLRSNPEAIEKNPQTINRICERVRNLDLDELYEKCTEPKETNRQMGPLFRRWVKSGALGIRPVSQAIFNFNNDDAILDGSDSVLLNYAKKHLGYTRSKGVDLVARFNGKYIIGEAKFISAIGGHQTAQFNDAISTIGTNANNCVIKIGIMDGVLYLEPKRRTESSFFNKITEKDIPVMSALVLKEYLYSL